MKKRLIYFLILSLLLLSSCGKSGNVSNVKEAQKPEHPNFEDFNADMHKGENVIDLRKVNGNILYAEVYNMMLYPKEYEGKTIKVTGQYYGEPDPADDEKFYHFVFIADAAACCRQGLEFIASEGFTGVEDTPFLEQEIEVSGVWGKYQDGEHTYYRLNDAEVKIRE